MLNKKNSRLGGVYIQFAEQKKRRSVAKTTTNKPDVDDNNNVYLVDEKWFYLTDESGNKLFFQSEV